MDVLKRESWELLPEWITRPQRGVQATTSDPPLMPEPKNQRQTQLNQFSLALRQYGKTSIAKICRKEKTSRSIVQGE